ncbi:ABC-type proline/glycine betaine transport system ATPase subunit [Paenibacillus rhizosphaerae]|uniref:ABC-type proline/glycine betaine transport system ATPase subunit n=1 Tax=Paenibacillus rhizosphaerae TaxID=297318 RepID=A0A839TLY9_9BACL|nr:hypothetical protein [Paenibacillus rhizosphaerae]MBB3126750.1 ABC-type proline/glycine betaine transport system ATPase subunit [Paenibacillus rhizosphaerae]
MIVAKLAGSSREDCATRADELLQKMGLTHRKNAYPHKLSGGNGSGWRSPGR